MAEMISDCEVAGYLKKKGTATTHPLQARQGLSTEREQCPLLPEGKGAPSFPRPWISKFAGLKRNAKNSAQKNTIQLSRPLFSFFGKKATKILSVGIYMLMA